MFLFPAALLALSCLGLVQAGYPVTGVLDDVTPNGPRPARQNIETLQADSHAWPIYIQALAALQADDQSSITSYFEIAGIHGRPYKGWEDVTRGNTNTGFCTHGSILFPTWHRPFLALFEQELNRKARVIASQYSGPDSQQYKDAATHLRMPYWDWAVNSNIPAVVNTPKIQITKPGGSELIDNPLYSYRFPSLDSKYFPRDQFTSKPTTYRDSSANGNLAQAGLTSLTYNLFSRVTDFTTFSTHSISGVSLESVHDVVHGSIGGDMGVLPYSAFDPIFWLHHTNVDRIYALWQATHPTSFIPTEGLLDQSGTFSIPASTVEKSSTPLAPFYTASKAWFYSSDTSRYTSTFGYTYPEIDDWSQSPAQLAATVTAKVNALYSPSAPIAKNKIHARDLSTSTQVEWFGLVSVPKYALQGDTFVVLLFVGAPPSDSSTYKEASNLAGSLLVTPPPGGVYPDMKVHGEFSLNEILVQAQLSSYTEESVVSYLTANLQWKVQKLDGTNVDLAECEGIKVQVQVEDITPAVDSSTFPTYSQPRVHPEITEGKQ